MKKYLSISLFLICIQISHARQMAPSAVNAGCAVSVVQSIDALRAFNPNKNASQILSLFYKEHFSLIFPERNSDNNTDFILLNPIVLEGKSADIAVIFAFKQDGRLKFVISNSNGAAEFRDALDMKDARGFLVLFSSAFKN